MVQLCDDFNAQTSGEADYMEPDTFLCEFEPEEILPEDGTVNGRGQELMTFCEEAGFRIVNGRIDGIATLVDLLV